MKKLIIGIVAGALLLGSGCQSNSEESSTPESSIELTQTIDAFGVVKSKKIEDIRIDFPAVIEKVHVKEGENVNKGDLLFTINYDKYKEEISAKKLELHRLKSNLQNDKLELDKLEQDLSKLQSHLANKSYPEIKKLSNELLVAEENYTKALEEFNAKKSLFESGTISKSELNTLERNVQSYKNNISIIENNISTLEYNLQKEIEQLQLSINLKSSSKTLNDENLSSLKNTINLMKEKLNKDYIDENKIISSIDNAIAYELTYVEGESISPSQKLISLMNHEEIIVETNIPEEFIKDITLGSELTISPQADRSKTYTGKITYIASNAVRRNGETTIFVETSIDNDDGFLMPGFNVNLQIDMD
ncbi:efflux RND transporter periplasmic adaptor subunit [Herbivorax sp. ANBcel31]|uniref:HlyD family secretion protein n=1 Tax=Herbivorax sp. ANBcel31 TaxID=3069754 RepID=UPI0027B6FF04|nr:efflux RND transporter periplasmic adaptor subunit [Herbivorax sp. ANBcel31]MDQ2086233.1 efflux RND transporter periplasmic adaptor subunit [Herbivorax sp. ANBcel31]